MNRITNCVICGSTSALCC